MNSTKKTALATIAAFLAAFLSIISIDLNAQYTSMASVSYCDNNRRLAAAEAVQQLGPQIQPAVSQEVQRIAQDIATNLYPIVVVETNLNIVATQIVDNVISNYTLVSNVLVYSENTYITNNVIVNAQTNITTEVDVVSNLYYTAFYTNVYNNTFYTTNIVIALTNATYNIDYTTNITYDVNYTTNLTYDVNYTTNLTYNVNVVTNIDVAVTNTTEITTNIYNQFIIDVNTETNSYFEVLDGQLRLYQNGILVWEETKP